MICEGNLYTSLQQKHSLRSLQGELVFVVEIELLFSVPFVTCLSFAFKHLS